MEENSPFFNTLLERFSHADDIVQKCESPPVKSCITTRPRKDSSSDEPEYEDFMPFCPTILRPEISLQKYDSVALLYLFSDGLVQYSSRHVLLPR